MQTIRCRAGTPIPAFVTHPNQASSGGNRRSRPTICGSVIYVFSSDNFILKFNLIFVLLLLLTPAAAHASALWWQDHPATDIASYTVPPQGALADRAAAAPDFLADYITRHAQSEQWPVPQPPAAYPLTDADRRTISEITDLLPARVADTVSPRVAGMFFMENLPGSGFTLRVPDAAGADYYVMLFDAESLRLSASEWITAKEKTCFIADDPAYDIEIDIGADLPGFYYIFLHEIGHVYDYIQKFTPGDAGHAARRKIAKYKKSLSLYPFTRRTWKEFDEPVEKYEFEGRADVTFYGMGGGPVLKLSHAAALYRSLEQTPFVTLYGAMSWHEDFAEFFSAYVSARVLGRPWRLRVTHNGTTIYELSDPAGKPAAEQRIGVIEESLKTE